MSVGLYTADRKRCTSSYTVPHDGTEDSLKKALEAFKAKIIIIVKFKKLIQKAVVRKQKCRHIGALFV